MTLTTTRQRILEAALELFNRYGYAATSQATIASAAGIRQGNLTYHLPTKMDLVEALRDEARVVLAERESVGASDDVCADYVDHVLTSMRLVWRYRFLLRDRAQLTDSDSESLGGAPPEVVADLERFSALIQRFAADGLLRRSLVGDVSVLARSLWIVSRYWLDHLDEFGQLDSADWASLARGIEQHRAVLDPCLTADGRRRLDDAFDRAASRRLAS